MRWSEDVSIPYGSTHTDTLKHRHSNSAISRTLSSRSERVDSLAHANQFARHELVRLDPRAARLSSTPWHAASPPSQRLRAPCRRRRTSSDGCAGALRTHARTLARATPAWHGAAEVPNGLGSRLARRTFTPRARPLSRTWRPRSHQGVSLPMIILFSMCKFSQALPKPEAIPEVCFLRLTMFSHFLFYTRGRRPALISR